jgi:hypothetical protein
MPISHIPIPVDELSEFLAVDPTSSTGLRWIQSPNRTIKEGDDAGGLATNIKRQVGFRYKAYRVSRVIYAIHHALDPGLLDVVHIDGDELNNTISNLTLMHPRSHRRPAPKKSGLPLGVAVRKGRAKPYAAHIRVEGRLRYLGHFLTPEEAAAAYQKALAEVAVKPSGTR